MTITFLETRYSGPCKSESPEPLMKPPPWIKTRTGSPFSSFSSPVRPEVFYKLDLLRMILLLVFFYIATASFKKVNIYSYLCVPGYRSNTLILFSKTHVCVLFLQ